MLSTLLRQVRFVTLTGITSLAMIATASAQGPGVAASVTSHGFGGHAGAAGVPASVTAHGSFAPNRPIMMHNPLIVNRGFVNESFVHRGFREHPRHPVREPRRFHHTFPGTVVYGFPYYPYMYDYDEDYSDQTTQDQEYENQQQSEEQYSNGGTTIFDRRGPGPEYQTWKDQNQSESDQPATTQVASTEPQPEPAAPPTVLVFKDGHQVEVANYAIVGATLFDLTPGHPRRVPISDLDLSATQKQNDDRGVDFRLPTGM